MSVVRFSEKIYERVKWEADMSGMTVSKYVENLMEGNARSSMAADDDVISDVVNMSKFLNIEPELFLKHLVDDVKKNGFRITREIKPIDIHHQTSQWSVPELSDNDGGQ